MNKILDIDTFIQCWKSFTEKNKDQLLTKYDGSDRTSYIFGGDKSTSDSSPFGHYFVEYFDNAYSYRKEDGLVDLEIFKSREFVKDIYEVTKGSDNKKLSLENYPRNYEVLIKHENDISRAHEGMFRLTNFRAYLKVLVTHIWDPSGDEMWAEVHKRLSKNFESIIKQTNEKYPENVETNYVLITGQRISGKLIWKYTGFWVMNTLKQIDSYVLVDDCIKPTINQ